jgi:fluoride ion exporter CrcB/FEX
VPRSPTSATSNRRPNRPRRHPGDLVAVAMGGLIGSALRAGIGVLLPTPSGGFPTGTLVVNLSGSLLIGLYLVRREQAATPRWSLPFWALGMLGSFTTLSATGTLSLRPSTRLHRRWAAWRRPSSGSGWGRC